MGNKQSKRDTASGNPGPRARHESVVVNNKLLVWGGEMNEDSHSWKFLPRCNCFAMDLHSQKWHPTIAIADSREDEPPSYVDARCAVIDNFVYSFGGSNGNYVYLNDMFYLDCNKMKWKKLEIKGSKPTARSTCELCAVGEKLVMFGGVIAHEDRGTLPEGAQYEQHNPSCGYANDCWEFCCHEVSWTPLVILGSSPSPRCGHSLTAVTALRIVLYGGWNQGYLSDMHVLDCEDGVWRWKEVKCSAMWPTGRAYHTTCCVSPSLCVVIGGWIEGDDPDGDAYVVDIERENAHRISVGDARALHTACCRVASDGSALIFVFGGTRDNFSDIKSIISDFRVYSWDPQTPFTISVCHNNVKRLLPDVVAQHVGAGEVVMPPSQASAESSDKPSAVSTACLSVRKETVRQEATRTVSGVVTDDTFAEEERETTNEMIPDTMHMAMKNEQVRRRLREVSAEKEQLNAEKEELVSQVRHLTAKKTSNRENEELIEELLLQIEQLSGEVDQLKQQCQKGRAEKEEMSSRQANLTLKVEELGGQLAEALTTSERLRQERQQLRRQVKHLHGNAGRLKEEKEKLRREREQQEKYIENLNGGLKHYSLQNEDLMKQLKQSVGIVEVTKQVSEAKSRLHLLCEAIRVEENRQLIQDNKQSHYLRQTHLNDFHIERCLGQSTTKRRGHYGCNSIIYRVIRRTAAGSNAYALKALFNPHAIDVAMEDAAIKDLFRAEYDLPCRPHPNVMRVLHHFCDSVPPQGLPKWPEFGGGRSLFLVMKKYDCNLQTYCRQLRERGLLDERFLLTILLQLLKAIEHLIQHNILHLDLKLDNVLVKVEQTVTRAVICDFGCSYESPHSLTTANATVLSARVGGNPNHHSPELCTLSSDPTVVCDVSKADIWAVGLMAYEIVTGRDAATILSYQHKKTRYTSEILPQLEGSFSVSCSHLLQQFVSHSVESRPSAPQAIQLCYIVLYGPTIPTLSEMTVEKAQHWLEQQLISLRPKSNEDLRKDPFYMRYLDLFSPDVVKHVINKFLMR